MLTSIILLNVERSKINETAENLRYSGDIRGLLGDGEL